MDQQTKPRYKSKTYWFNGALLTLAISVLTSSELQAWIETLPPSYAVWVAAGIGLVNMALREVTSTSVR